MEAVNGNLAASRDGAAGENLAYALFGENAAVHALIDYQDVNGAPVEVKACRRWIRSAHVTTARRRGRFMLNGEQHAALTASGGYYLFVLLDDEGRAVSAKCTPAATVTYARLTPDARAVGIVWTDIMGDDA